MSSSKSSSKDVIDLLAGIEPGSFVDRIRAERPETRLNAQKSYLALFEPREEGDVTRGERLALATFVAGLHQADEASGFYDAGLSELAGGSSLSGAVRAEVDHGVTNGPYGSYPEGPLSAENKEGLVFAVSDIGRAVFGQKLSAGLEHTHLLVFRPRDASPNALQTLLDAGWSTTGIVTLSQIVAFLSFQIRVIKGLKALGAAGAGQAASSAAAE
ncbi:CMD domain protein [Rhizobium sp. 768_B6_N1_8]|uniref:CMD domain protein n=1 Tax=unclassified Rhizobium TaxID=2613769 RepID=UPI003F259990